MNRYDYYTRRANFDEQEWLTEELYYPEQEDAVSYGTHTRYTPSYEDYEDYDYGLYNDEDPEYMYDDEDVPAYEYDDGMESQEPYEETPRCATKR